MPKEPNARWSVRVKSTDTPENELFSFRRETRSSFIAERRITGLLGQCFGYMVEVPLVFLAYVVSCIILFPYLSRNYNEVLAIICILTLGAVISFLFGILISVGARPTVLKLPISVWCFFLFSSFSGPFMVAITRRHGVNKVYLIIIIIMVLQPLLAYWVDYRFSIWWEDRHRIL